MATVTPVPKGIDPGRCATLVELLRLRATHAPDGLAYVFLQDGETEAGRFTFGELDRRARAVATTVQERGAPGEPAVLVYQPGLDYVVGFFGCLYAGLVPAPVYPPRPNRSARRVQSVLDDAGATIVLTSTGVLSDPRVGALDSGTAGWICTDAVRAETASGWRDPRTTADALALLQYTSGATATPKGVMVSHANILANQRMIQRALGHTATSTFVSWLPIYHDMGLIGNLLQPLYVGASCIFMSPTAFLQRPVRWLRAIDIYEAHTSGAPNFAYDLCVQRIAADERESLDLSRWRVAYNGSEPVRAETLERFTEAFAPCGFRREAFWPCYGLAEATLLVSGGPPREPPVVRRFEARALSLGHATDPGSSSDADRKLVGCGSAVSGVEIVIVDPETAVACDEGRTGEVWLRGPGIARGYWKRADDSAAAFAARRRDTSDGPYLRTGDLGFQLDGELFLTGRLKDLIIVRGRNHYPQDIEETVERCHAALLAGGAAACAVETGEGERLVVFAEVTRHHYRNLPLASVVSAVRSAVADEHDLHVHDLILLRPGGLPRTSSGKKQRHACREWFLTGGGNALAEWRDPVSHPDALLPDSALSPRDVAELEDWLAASLATELAVPVTIIDRHAPLTSHGVDSITATTLCHRIESTLGVTVSAADLIGEQSLAEVAAAVWAAGSASVDATGPSPSPAPETEAPLTHGQRALWFLHQIAPTSAAYNIARAARVTGEIDTTALQGAVDTLVRRHDALRTGFETRDGQPLQRIFPHRPVPVVEVDTYGWEAPRLREELERAARRPFDLQRDPLLRLTLFRGGPENPVLLLCVHHIVADLWSLALMMRELGELYVAARRGNSAFLPRPPLRYSDFVRWEAELLAGPRGQQLRAFWEDQLGSGIPPLDLPVDRPARPGVGPRSAGTERFGLGRTTSAAVRSLARRFGATLYMTHLAALEALLYRYTGRERFVVGSLTAGRSRAGLAGVVGYLVNPLALRADVSGAEPFSSLLRRTCNRVKDALRHQDYPFALAVETLRPDRSAGRPQVLQVMFVFQRTHLLGDEGLTRLALAESGAHMEWGGLSLQSFELDPPSALFDLTLTIADIDGEIRGSLDYCADLFDRSTAHRMTCHLRSLLAGAAADPECRIDDLPLVFEPESVGVAPGAGASW